MCDTFQVGSMGVQNYLSPLYTQMHRKTVSAETNSRFKIKIEVPLHNSSTLLYINYLYFI